MRQIPALIEVPVEDLQPGQTYYSARSGYLDGPLRVAEVRSYHSGGIRYRVISYTRPGQARGGESVVNAESLVYLEL